MARILLNNVTLSYPIFNSVQRSMRTEIFRRLGGQVASHDNVTLVHALRGLTLDLMDGARLGIIGHNGSGKTTLLRLISGVYTPQAGDVHIVGRLSSYTDIALGMDPEANGYDNIIFRCVFLGLTFREARAAIPAIAEFSDLGNFLNMPVRTYSTGMFVRLAFSISTHLYSDILVMDEMIGAGDAAFIEKARKRTEEVVQKAKILVIASHDANLLQALCNKVLWLERGEQRMLGNPAEVLDAYRKSVSNAA